MSVLCCVFVYRLRYSSEKCNISAGRIRELCSVNELFNRIEFTSLTTKCTSLANTEHKVSCNINNNNNNKWSNSSNSSRRVLSKVK